MSTDTEPRPLCLCHGLVRRTRFVARKWEMLSPAIFIYCMRQMDGSHVRVCLGRCECCMSHFMLRQMIFIAINATTVAMSHRDKHGKFATSEFLTIAFSHATCMRQNIYFYEKKYGSRNVEEQYERIDLWCWCRAVVTPLSLPQMHLCCRFVWASSRCDDIITTS